MYNVAQTIFACLYHALRCFDEKQETAVSSSSFVQISLHCTPPSQDSSSSCEALIISRDQAINLLLPLVVFFGCFFATPPIPPPALFFLLMMLIIPL